MNGPRVIGVDLGGTYVRAAVVEEGHLQGLTSVPIRSRGDEKEVLEDVFKAIDPHLGGDVQGLGLGVPSVIDLASGTVYDVQNIPSWKEVPLRKYLEERYRLPVYLNNDANCFAAGEKHFGKARPFRSAVGLIVGTGLGAGIIANGKLYSGANCGAGEFGMLPYLDRHFEFYCSGQYFQNRHRISGKELAEKAAGGDRRARNIFDDFGTHLGEALKAIVYAVDPEIIILGGSVSKSFRFFRDSLWKTFQTLAYSVAKEKIRIEISETENIAVLGAAALFHDALGIQPGTAANGASG